MNEVLQQVLKLPMMASAYHLQVRTLKLFHGLAREICGKACPVEEPDEAMLAFGRNFFSSFFLSVTDRLVGFGGYMPLYAMVNQGLRAWLTSIDNIVDDEYKEIFRFCHESQGARVRSALTLLLADRVVQEFILREYSDVDILSETGLITLRALGPTALAQSEEEFKPVRVLSSAEILDRVHARKTAELFLAPLALPTALEEIDPAQLAYGRSALMNFGLACQVLDDVRDLPEDIRAGRHNVVVSLLHEMHGFESGATILEGLRNAASSGWQSWQRFPEVVAEAGRLALTHFRLSYENLQAIGNNLVEIPVERTAAMICDLIRIPPSAIVAGHADASAPGVAATGQRGLQEKRQA